MKVRQIEFIENLFIKNYSNTIIRHYEAAVRFIMVAEYLRSKILSVANSFSYVPYKKTGYFSSLVTDYLDGHNELKAFYRFSPTAQGIAEAIAERSQHPVDRKILVGALQKQYATLKVTDRTAKNIELLAHDNTFTVCTAHQPNLLTGYLYFIYKIIHAIKLADQLNGQYPDKHFVPVYYMGSEDNDIDELGVFRFRGAKYVWDGSGQKGAVGRMSTKGLNPLLTELIKVFGPPGNNCDELMSMITAAYLQHDTIGQATQYLVNELFGQYGLVVIDPDDAGLKKSFIPVMENELLKQDAQPVIAQQIEQLGANYKIQAYPREINLFYLHTQLRERIERQGDKWTVVNTDIEWNKEELLTELHQHPERFSPNVMLRGLFQETILPNVAFIGGGAEVAYWFQLKSVFEHFRVFYPVVLLRQSALFITAGASRLIKQLEFGIDDIFMPEEELQNKYVLRHTSGEWQTQAEAEEINAVLKRVEQKAVSLDPTLQGAAGAAMKKIHEQLTVLEKKMLRAEKKKQQVQMDRISRMKQQLFPNKSLQERVENFSEYYLQYGRAFFDVLLDGTQPLSHQFLVIEE